MDGEAPPDRDPAGQIGRIGVAVAMLASDPAGLGGLRLRARAGPSRDAAVALLHLLPAPLVRIPVGTDEGRLFGGFDVAMSLASGHAVTMPGLIDAAATLILPSAERLEAATAARLAGCLDGGAPPLVALDEGIEDEAMPSALAERLALHLDLDETGRAGLDGATCAPAPAPPARSAPADHDALTRIAARLGVDSMRALIFAVRAAEAHAGVMGRGEVAEPDLIAACEMVLVPRAVQLPTQEDDGEAEPDAPPELEESDGPQDQEQSSDGPVADRLLDAVASGLPPDVLARLDGRGGPPGQAASGSGARKSGNRRGRPLPSRKGRPDGRTRIDVTATLRAAAPFQKMRDGEGLKIRGSDIHLRRYEEASDRVLVFAVDASGSAAVARLSEAKGAVELLLSEAYARRDHVALVAFRGTGAELLLPPTRSLVQTKRRLAALPGGGGTPLASGLRLGLEVALHARRRGMTPSLVLLTDGRANVGLDGTGGRSQAAEDSARMARAIRAEGIDGLVIDTGARPERSLSDLADTLGAIYIALPRADARRLSAAVAAGLRR